MKRKMSTALMMVMIGALLAACGKDATLNESEKTQVTEEVTEEKPETDQTEETGDAAIENPDDTKLPRAEEVRPLQLMKDCKEVFYTDSESYDDYMKYVDVKILLTEDEAANFPALAATLVAEVDRRNDNYLAELDLLIEDYRAEQEYGNGAGFFSKNEPHVERADTLALSIRDSVSDYTGGAHGNYGVSCYNYNTQTGQVLKFSDVVADPVAFLMLANDKIQESFSGDFETPAGLEDFYEDYDTSIIWTIDYQGVRLYFNPYTLGSYALGMIETEIYFAEAPELFHSEYFNIPKSYAVEIGTGDPVWMDIDLDGENEKITITPNYDDYSYMIGADIEVENEMFHIDEEVDRFYYVSNNGKPYLVIFASDEGGYWTIFTADLTTMKPDTDHVIPGSLVTYNYNWIDDDERSEYNYVQGVFTDPGKVMISTYLQYLGSMTGWAYYHMGEDAIPVADTGVFTIDSTSVITANRDIKCELVDLDGNRTGEAVIPEGTKLVVRRGDGETFADLIEVPADADVSDYEYYESLNSELKMEDADFIYRVKGELNEYGSMALIDGEEEYLVFSRIMYAD